MDFQATHNIAIRQGIKRDRVVDPEPTPLGIKQAINLRETFPHMDKITHILCSPLKRTLHTARLAFEPLTSQGLKIVAYPDIREQGRGLSSTGTNLEGLLKLHPKENQLVDLTLVPEGWEINTEDTEEEEKYGIRAKSVRKELWKLATEALKEEGGLWKGHDVSRGSTHKNIEILVASHGAFLKKMCEQKSKCSRVQGEVRLENADLGLQICCGTASIEHMDLILILWVPGHWWRRRRLRTQIDAIGRCGGNYQALAVDQKRSRY